MIHETISEDFYNQNQSWNFVWTLKVNNKKIRMMVCRNAYDNQSYIRGFLWANGKYGEEWHQVDHIPMTKDLACYNVSYVTEKPNKALFKQDAMDLLERVVKIVF